MFFHTLTLFLNRFFERGGSAKGLVLSRHSRLADHPTRSKLPNHFSLNYFSATL